MMYEPLGNFVKLSQGLAVNKGTAHLFADMQTDEFVHPLLRIVDLENDNHTVFSKYVAKNVPHSVIINEDTIVFSRVTCQCFRGFAGVVHNNLFVVELINDSLDKDYLFTILQSEFVKNQAMNLAKSSVVPDLTHDMFKSILIPVPEKKVQKQISEAYRSLSAKISNNKAICKDIEAMAKLLYDYWFVQFDFPDENGRPYKSSGGKMVWNEELKREIPEGWGVEKFDNLVDAPPKLNAIKAPDYQSKGKIPIVDQASSLITGYTDDEHYLFSNTDGCVVFGDVTTYFKFINFPFAKGTDGTKIIRSKNNRIPSLLLYHLIKDCNLPNVGFARHYIFLREIKVIVPSVDLCEKYNVATCDMMDLRKKIIEENQVLSSLRDFLLPMLMNEQVGFKNEG